MRALIVSPIPSHPPVEGNRERAVQVCEALRELGYGEQFFCLVRIPPIHAEGFEAALREEWGSSLQILETGWSAAAGALRVPARTRWVCRLQRILRPFPGAVAWMEQFHAADAWCPPGVCDWVHRFATDWRPDLVVVVYPFLSRVLEGLPGNPVGLIDSQDVFTRRNQRLASAGVEERWLSLTAAQERRLLSRGDCVMAIQDDEASFFQRLVPQQRVITVSALAKPVMVAPPSAAPLTCGILASANPPNLAGMSWFLREVLPLIRLRCPEMRLLVAGSLASALEPAPGVELLGRVDDRSAFYTRCRVTVNPCRGGTGIKIKSLEALTFGRPVVATSHGAVGLLPDAEGCVFASDDAAQFADACLRFLFDGGLADEAGRVGREFILQRRQRGLNCLEDGLRRATSANGSPQKIEIEG